MPRRCQSLNATEPATPVRRRCEEIILRRSKWVDCPLSDLKPALQAANLIGRFYERTGRPESAVYYYRHCLRTFPGTKHAKESQDRLKTVTQGYGSFDYEMLDYRETKIAKVDILVNGESVDIKVMDGKVWIDGAEVVTTDIEATNGVIHVINKVILPSPDLVVTMSSVYNTSYIDLIQLLYILFISGSSTVK